MVARLVLIFLCLTSCLAISCASKPKHDYTFLANPPTINTDEKVLLTANDLEQDREKLLFALNNAYSGSRFLPGDQFAHLITDINSIQAPLTSGDLCHKLGEAFAKVSDNHIDAHVGKTQCRIEETRHPGVGKNFYTEKDHVPWSVKMEKRQSKTALLISIVGFPFRKDPKWNGFLDAVKAGLKKADLIILDMRGNDGGDDTIGYELSTLLAGRELNSPMNGQWRWNRPESFQVFINVFQFWIDKAKSEGKEPPPHLVSMVEEFKTNLEKALRGELKESRSHQDTAFSFDPKLAVQKPIYILIDRECVSSCESTTDDFEYNTFAKTVGENSGGYIHFSNNGVVFLPHSGVAVQMATSYNSYVDGRFLEKKGITPKIAVPPGKSALDFAWNDFLTNQKKN